MKDILKSLGLEEYAPLDVVYNFISDGLPGIKIKKMYMPVETDEEMKYMYVAKSHLVGHISDSELQVANNCLELLSQEIDKQPDKENIVIGIYGLIEGPKVVKRKTDFSRETTGIIETKVSVIVLRFAFAEKIEDDPYAIEEPYQPKYTKKQNPFEYDMSDIIQRVDDRKND